MRELEKKLEKVVKHKKVFPRGNKCRFRNLGDIYDG